MVADKKSLLVMQPDAACDKERSRQSFYCLCAACAIIKTNSVQSVCTIKWQGAELRDQATASAIV